MVIDTHIRPALFSPICENKERFEKRCDQMNYHLMKPSSIELLKKQYALAGIEKVFLLPSDCSFETENRIYQTTRSRRSYNVIRRFLSGLRLQIRERNRRQKNWKRRLSSKIWRDFYINTARLHMYPCDERLFVLYDICKKYKRPIIFQAGLSMENNLWQNIAVRLNLRRF